MNGHANCIYAICCPPDSPNQISALAEEMAAGVGGNLAEGPAYATAAWVLKNFDLAPKGSLQGFKDEIARLAREPRDKGDGKV